METFGSYQLIEKISETKHFRVFRARKEIKSETVVIKVITADYPTQSEIARFKQEYNLLKSLSLDGIIKMIELVQYDNRFGIVMEDVAGETWKELIGSETKPSLDFLLKMSIQLTETLGLLHKKSIIHGDIKPSNLFVDQKTGKSKIIDFGISTILTHANEEIYHRDVVTGILPYISPEQTGRMNRLPDYRTDIYSLGVTLYELFTGSLPFISDDPMELIHSHIAKMPSPPSEKSPGIPDMISSIIMRLMEKPPEKRYQSCFGLKVDLEKCLESLEKTGAIETFPLGSLDISRTLNIPQVLVGRDLETRGLMSSFERACEGEREMMLIKGHSGSGKSALVHEIHKPVVAGKGYFISGKYDQLRRDVPYSAMIQAFKHIVRQILSEGMTRIEQWRESIEQALGVNGKVITDVILDLKHIIGPQPEVEELAPEESQNRFKMVFQNFVKVFARKNHPLVLFLDDMQWADIASLNLIKTLMTTPDIRYFYLICAYRDNEVSESHPFLLTTREIEKSGVRASSISLSSLSCEDINTLVATTLRCKPDYSISLARLIHEKTHGNPFFAIQFFKTLYDNNTIYFDPSAAWKWDMDEIKNMQVTENVVELLAEKITSLSGPIQDTLKICACIGNRFDLMMISVVSGESVETILGYITVAIQNDFIRQSEDEYRFYHDRIQEAAYSLIPENQRVKMHYTIGINSLNKISEEDRNTKVFYITDHLNQGVSLIVSPLERLELAELNCKAGTKARESSAYDSALNYLLAGIDLLPQNAWDNHYELTYQLNRELLECQYLTNNDLDAEKTFNHIVQNARTNVDKANVYSQMIVLKNAAGDYESALAIGFEALRILNSSIPRNVSGLRMGFELLKLRIQFGRKKIEDLLILSKKMEQPDFLSIANLTIQTGAPAYYTSTNLVGFLIVRGVSMFLKHGYFDEAALSTMGLANILGPVLGFYDQGYRFAETALKLHEKYGGIKNKCKLWHIFAYFTLYTKRHAREGLDYMREAYKAGLQTGDVIYCGYTINVTFYHRLVLGHNIEEVMEEYSPFKDFLMGCKDHFTPQSCIRNNQIIKCLKGETDKRGYLSSADFNEQDDLDFYEIDGNQVGTFFSLCDMLKMRYLFGLYEECPDLCRELLFLIEKKVAMGTIHVPESIFYISLALAKLCTGMGFFEKRNAMKVLRQNQKKMKIWSKHCPENFLHKYLLVEAERARIKGKIKRASLLYDRAIESARHNEYTQNEAIANELAAKLRLVTGDDENAGMYMKEAHLLYYRWGAMDKVRQLEELYPALLKNVTVSAAKGVEKNQALDSNMGMPMASISGSLDMTTMIRASHDLAAEIDLGLLLEKIISRSIKNAGAEHGILVLENKEDGRLYIEATGNADGASETLKKIPLKSYPKIPETIVNYVYKTGKNVVLSDASTHKRFGGDPYIASHKPKSILCSPIKYKGQTAGVIYLENNLVSDAFTDLRVELLQVLSSHAAISIENARLFDSVTKAEAELRTINLELEDRVERRTRELEKTTRELKGAYNKIMSSIRYAGLIQHSLLPVHEDIKHFLPESFFIWQPRDIVGGDLYTCDRVDNGIIISVIDCTGHSVPGAFMTMLAGSAIRRIIHEERVYDPARILKRLNRIAKTLLHHEEKGPLADDGFDAGICFYKEDDKTLFFAGAGIPLYVMGKDNIAVIKGDRHSIGYISSDPDYDFATHSVNVSGHPKTFYLMTDGFTDQLGGNEKIRFGTKTFKSLLEENHEKSFEEQKALLIEAFDSHKGGRDQTDDVTLVGFRFNC